MDIDDIVNRCPHATNIHRMSFDQRILVNVPYIMSGDDDEVCTDLQTLYNTVYNKENAYGSSYRYTVPPFLDNMSGNNHRKKERFNELDNQENDPDFMDYMLPVVSFIVMVVTIIILIYRSH